MSIFGRSVRRISPALHSSLVAIKRGEFEVAPPRRIYAEKHLHRLIRSVFPVREGVFIEAGANDGVTRSNTYYLARHQGWRGVLVEPMPHRAAQCSAARLESVTINAALVAEETFGGTVEIVDMDRMSMVATDDNALSLSAHRQHFEQIATKYGQTVRATRYAVPARALKTILADLGNPKVDFFSLDVEGFELEVLRGLDFAACAPRFILVEDWDRSGVADILTQNGYELHTRIDKDTLYERRH